MSVIKSFSVDNGDMFYINHNRDNFTVIDCNLTDLRKKEIMDEICQKSYDKNICRFISTHPDEDHFHGIEYFNNRKEILNFYCVANEATKSKDNETESFKKYCELRDSKKAFNIYCGCSRKWMNEAGNNDQGVYIGSSGINIVWPKTENENYKEALIEAKNGGSPNNISPVIKYSLQDGVTVLWFGDLEKDFMESIEDNIDLPKADIIFAPHHGRKSGKLPTSWLETIEPQVIIIGEAASDNLDYYKDYNTITQNTAKDITLSCVEGKVHFYSSNINYSKREYLKDEKMSNGNLGYYIGTLIL